MRNIPARYLPMLLALTLAAPAAAGDLEHETAAIKSDGATLTAFVWRPAGRGPFPAVLVNHGSGRTAEQLRRLGPYEQEADAFCPVFARHGYVCVFPFRRGVGPSNDQGRNAIDLMTAAADTSGTAARNAVQMDLLQNRELRDAMASLDYVRDRPDVDRGRIALVGHSFGGSLTVLLAERSPDVKSVVLFSLAGYSWDRSPELRARLLDALTRVSAPMFFIHAANDYSTNPGIAMDRRLAELGKPHRVKIYPPHGRTPDEGHDLPLTGTATWESDVFGFLGETIARSAFD